MNKKELIILTPLFIFLSHYLAVFPHEFCHSFMAWILGDKINPFNLKYGGTSLANLLILIHINENVDYQSIFAAGNNLHVAAISFAGPGIANGLLFILSLILLNNKTIQKHLYWYYFLFWFNLMNLGNFYDYVPIRTFTTRGDMGHFEQGLGVSHWYIYIIFGYLVLFLIWQFFTKTLISSYTHLKLTIWMQGFVMIISVLILLGFFGLPGMVDNYGDISYFLSATSLLLIPVLILLCWPSRKWVTQLKLSYEGAL